MGHFKSLYCQPFFPIFPVLCYPPSPITFNSVCSVIAIPPSYHHDFMLPVLSPTAMASSYFLSSMGSSIQTHIFKDLKLGLTLTVIACTRLEEDQADKISAWFWGGDHEFPSQSEELLAIDSFQKGESVFLRHGS